MFAVFLDDRAFSADDAVAVFAAAGFRTTVDARAAAARAAGGVLVDDADAVSAGRLKDALSHRGFGAAVVDVNDLSLPVPQRTKELVIKDDGFDVADSLGRLSRVPMGEVVLLAAIRTRVVSSDAPAKPTSSSPMGKLGSTALSIALPGAQTAAKMVKAIGGGGATPSTAMVEREELFVEVVLRDKRLRLDQSGVVFRAGGPRSLADLAARWTTSSPQIPQQRGFRALAHGDVVPMLKSLREFDREVGWCRWRLARGDAPPAL